MEYSVSQSKLEMILTKKELYINALNNYNVHICPEFNYLIIFIPHATFSGIKFNFPGIKFNLNKGIDRGFFRC